VSRIWKYKELAVQELKPELVAAADNLPILAKLLAIRGITDPAEAQAFLNLPEYQPQDGSAFPDMQPAVKRLQKAIKAQEPILVYGDFDVDGITGTSVLMQCLKALKANVSFYIPSRHTEGHGLNTAALCRLVSARQLKVVITTDTGSSNFNEVHLLNGLGVDTIITDHHELPENLPEALAILNPKLLPESSPLAYLAGVGIAYKLCEALLQATGAPQSQTDALLDLVALGTVVDMVPLLRENRYLVWRGLEVLARRGRPGITAILLEANVSESAPITAQTLGFSIGPRLNAVGRIDSANDGVEILTTNDPNIAKKLAARLEQLNRKRKDMVEQCLLEAERHLMASGALTDEKAIILASPEWNQGVVGLVATKLIEKYHRPCFMGFVNQDTQEIHFSARSIEGFRLHENLQTLEDLFIRWGGHSGAAGFVIAQKHLQTLKSRLFRLCTEKITDQQLTPVTWVDMTLTPQQVNPYLMQILDRMAPFGQSNPLPIFGFESVSIGAQRFIGEAKNHLKLILNGAESGQYLEAIHWNWGENRQKLNANNLYRLAFVTERNLYNGSEKVQLLLKDIQDASSPVLYEEIPISVAIPMLPIAGMETKQTDLDEAEGFRWIDHRGRDEIERFLAQVLAPAAETYRIFCEGTHPLLPLPLPESLFLDRRHGSPKVMPTDLILWDLPPDLATLEGVLKIQQPKTIHLIGAKYRKIPIYRPPQEFLDGFLKVLYRLVKQQGEEPFTIEIGRLAVMLSTTPQVVMTALGLLSRLQLLSLTVLPNQAEIQIDLRPASETVTQNITEMIEYLSFRSALQEVCRFREWLLTAPISAIKSTVSLETAPEAVDSQEERKAYVVSSRD
jgi:single-stranded-DNA-specific exonuclease